MIIKNSSLTFILEYFPILFRLNFINEKVIKSLNDLKILILIDYKKLKKII